HRAHRLHQEPLRRRRGRRVPPARHVAARRHHLSPIATRGHAERGTSFHGVSRDGSGSLGRPSTRSPRMLRMIADVPPSILLACARRNPRATVRGSSAAPPTKLNVASAVSPLPSHATPLTPARSTASFCTRWLNSALCNLVIEPSGPASAPLRRRSAARWLLRP